MTYVRKYTKEQLIALARKRGNSSPEDATDEELEVVERRLSAERGWRMDP
jgi:transposase